MTSLPNNPLRTVAAVIGTTGVGKSNLAIALAESLKTRNSEGVVLSADSMQIYKGLDVITNKITKEEMKGVRHWGLDMVKPGEGNWEMGRWCLEADREVGHDVIQLDNADSRSPDYQRRPYRSYVVGQITLSNTSYSHRVNYLSKEKRYKSRNDGLLLIPDRKYQRSTPSSRNYWIHSGRNNPSGQSQKPAPAYLQAKRMISSYPYIDSWPRWMPRKQEGGIGGMDAKSAEG